MTVRVRVKAVGITCVKAAGDGSGAGGDLEIYGHLGAWAKAVGGSTPRVEELLFNRPKAEFAQAITFGATLFVGEEAEFDVRENENLWIGGHLKEADPIGDNDSLHDTMRSFHHDDVAEQAAGNHTIEFRSGDGQDCDALYEITVL